MYYVCIYIYIYIYLMIVYMYGIYMYAWNIIHACVLRTSNMYYISMGCSYSM